MRHTFLTFIALTVAAAASAQQEKPQQDQAAAKKATTITMSGCVQKGEPPLSGYTLTDGTSIYRLTGVDVRDFVGRRVEISGGAPRKLKIVGGLTPSANVAAQAGSMDPARAATAAVDASTVKGTGTPEFHVRSIKPIAGSCTQ